MIGAAGGSYNLNAIGNVGLYAANVTKEYMATHSAENGKTAHTGMAQDVIDTVTKNTVGFARENTKNLTGLKSAAATLESAARGLGTGESSDDVIKAAQDFAQAYNKTVSFLTSGAADGAGVTKALGLVADNRLTQGSIGHYGSYAANRLGAMGISIDKDGMMQVDSAKLKSAAENSPASVSAALSGYGSVTDTTQSNADKAMRIPTATYTDFSKTKINNSLISQLMPNAGFLFDISL